MRHEQKTSWFGRNWIWVLGCGCLTIIGFPVACTALLGSAVWFGAGLSELPSEEDILAQVRRSSRAVEILGEPIETTPGFHLDGNLSSGRATRKLQVRGPRNHGEISAELRRRDETWVVDSLALSAEIDGARVRIELEADRPD